MIVHHEMFPGNNQGVTIAPSTRPNLTTFVLPDGLTGATSFTHDGRNSWTHTHMHPTVDTPWRVRRVDSMYVVNVGSSGSSTAVIYLDAATAEKFMNAAAELQTLIMTEDTEVTA